MGREIGTLQHHVFPAHCFLACFYWLMQKTLLAFLSSKQVFVNMHLSVFGKKDLSWIVWVYAAPLPGQVALSFLFCFSILVILLNDLARGRILELNLRAFSNVWKLSFCRKVLSPQIHLLFLDHNISVYLNRKLLWKKRVWFVLFSQDIFIPFDSMLKSCCLQPDFSFHSVFHDSQGIFS